MTPNKPPAALSAAHANVVAWAEARNLIKGATPLSQFAKLVSEAGEFAMGCLREDIEEIKDGIGDTMVVATIIAAQIGTDLLHCVELAANSPKVVGEEEGGAIILVILGKLGDSIAKNQVEVTSHLLGHLAIALNYICEELLDGEVTLTDAYASAYEEIKDRKGVMYNGVFIKSTDERFASVLIELGLPAEV